MKVAICISGFLRTWNETKRSFIETFCDGVDADVFLHLYRENLFEWSAGQEDVRMSEEEILDMFSGINVKGVVIETREKTLPQITKGAEEFIQHWPNFSIAESSDPMATKVNVAIRIYDQVRKIYECNNLRKKYQEESGVQYDALAYTRCDVLYLQKPDWQAALHPNVIYTDRGSTGGVPSDVAIIGNVDSMEKAVMNRFADLRLLFSSRPQKIDGKCCLNCGNTLPCCFWCSHSMIRHAALYHSIQVVRLFLTIVLRSPDSVHSVRHGRTVNITDLSPNDQRFLRSAMGNSRAT